MKREAYEKHLDKLEVELAGMARWARAARARARNWQFCACSFCCMERGDRFWLKGNWRDFKAQIFWWGCLFRFSIFRASLCSGQWSRDGRT